MRFLDSDVMVDLLRRHPPAVAWMQSLPADEPLGLPGFVALELIAGCRNKAELHELRRLLERHEIYWPREDDLDRALEDYSAIRLMHQLDILDLLIGECAIGHGAILCTFNQRHFRAVPRLKTEKPYERE
ncbi:MAG TPA: PIN domain-containing protein [bacterium]|nr:PIN domain-containing protein [bacterium]